MVSEEGARLLEGRTGPPPALSPCLVLSIWLKKRLVLLLQVTRVLSKYDWNKSNTINPSELMQMLKDGFKFPRKLFRAFVPLSLSPSLVLTTLPKGPMVLEQVYENQRFLLVWGDRMLPTERASWSNEDGSVKVDKSLKVDPKVWVWLGDWKLDMTYGDAEGWSYNIDFSHPDDWHREKHISDLVRRRLWVRKKLLKRHTAVKVKLTLEEQVEIALQSFFFFSSRCCSLDGLTMSRTDEPSYERLRRIRREERRFHLCDGFELPLGRRIPPEVARRRRK